jgi:hypothetical protein
MYFGIILELVNNGEAARISYESEQNYFALDIGSGLYDPVISRKNLHAT